MHTIAGKGVPLGAGSERWPGNHAYARWGMFYLWVALACCLAGMLDERLINGISVWNKPLKFAASIGVFFLTFAWFAPLLGRGYFSSWQGRLLVVVPLTCALLEMLYILLQAGRGEASHFNVDTPYHALAFGLMGFFAVLMISTCLWMGVVVLWRWRDRLDAYLLGVGLGLVLTFFLGGGFGLYLGSHGGHWIGGTHSDAAGLPLLRWSRDGGDLRVAHFFGIHAMQVIPLAGWWARRHLSPPSGMRLVVLVALAYAGFTLHTFFQALAGKPFL